MRIRASRATAAAVAGLTAAGLAAAGLAVGCGGAAGGKATTTTPGALAQPRDDDGARPAPRMTVRQAIGQRLVFAYDGLTPPRALERRIRRGEAAGVVLFSRNVRSAAQVRRTVDRLQRLPRPRLVDAPLLVMVDQEGGSVRRIPGAPARAASDTPSAAAARADGLAAARTLRAAGVNVDFAPVVDVARPGAAMEDESRTYGSDAATVARRAGAFAAGLRAGGVEPVLKHFPGFGAATINTDDGAARIDLPLSTLRSVDVAPYRRIRPRAVMLSTAVYPRVDPRPAAFSQRWVTGELRGRLRFGGVAVTDDLQGAAVARFGTPSQLAFFAMKAGVDVPLFAQDYATTARAATGLERAVRSGALPRADLDAGARRVLAWRAALPQPR
ncbi:MAG: beta-N-acetylhexosaminidase [Baekduia sp.]|nr:beta-N-acetylhexosaminidase [Baekduia sp.]